MQFYYILNAIRFLIREIEWVAEMLEKNLWAVMALEVRIEPLKLLFSILDNFTPANEGFELPLF